ncbi:hypothetical protein MCC10058_0742 [Bifidobacterium longum subsp. longum]|nr:hypothetical protein MCC10058_0742 [Bifidobacterium longum subsp. longum]
MADIPEEHLTEELLDRLLASASIEQYLDEGLVSARTLTDYLFDRMEAHGLKRADVVRASGLNATVVYDIFSGKSRPAEITPSCWLLVSSAHYAKPNGCFVLQAFPNCGANSDVTRLSSGAYAMDSTALPRTTSCIVWERRRCCRPIDDIRPNNTHQ